jgi:putative phosphoserine phosphatase/1-acylglycerol-3-phosphate O-acyltransferase
VTGVAAPSAAAAPRAARPRLPGTVAEVDASAPGPATGAFFDFDGTLIAGYSASVFANDRVRRRDVGLADVARLVRLGVEAGLGVAEFGDVLRLVGASMRGRTEGDVLEVGERLFVQKIAERVYPEARELVAAHTRRGHTVVLLSSATRFQVAPLARDLGIDHVVCNEFDVVDGVLTGEVRMPVVWGASKATAAQRFAAAHAVDPTHSYFYADGDEDAAFMYLVGQPRPTNPRRGLERVARRRGWPIVRFDSRGPVGPVGVVRNLLGLAALAPATAAGAVVGVVTRERRTGVDFMLMRWVDTLFALSGVKLRVQGREHAWAHRPAVFVFNHRNYFDVLMTGRIIERNFTAVAKKELLANPLVAGLGKLVDAVFLDRDDTNAAIDALQPVQDAVRNGISLLIAPEGTRSPTREVGPFKKGAFRIAMAAGVPIVPVVIRNADDVGPRDAAFMRSATVDICVLPPVSTDTWALDRLDDEIVAVHQLFVETLAHWPTD